MDYTDDEIRENSELASRFLSKLLPLEKKEDGSFSSDEFRDLGPCQIPCRTQDALFFALKSFVKELQAEAVRRHKAEYEGDYPVEEEYDPWDE